MSDQNENPEPEQTPESTPQPSPEVAELKAKLREFRDNNTSLQKQLESMSGELTSFKDSFGDLTREDVETIRAQTAAARDEKEAQMIKSGQIEELVALRTKDVVANINGDLKEAIHQRDQLQNRLDELEGRMGRENAVRGIEAIVDGAGLRLRPEARDDFHHRISSDWKATAEGSLMPAREDMLGNDGDPMSAAEYVKQLASERSYYFERPSGSNAQGSSKGAQRQQAPTRRYSPPSGYR